MLSTTTEPPLSACFIVILLSLLRFFNALRSFSSIFCLAIFWFDIFEDTISFIFMNVSKAAEPNGARQLDFSLIFRRLFVSANGPCTCGFCGSMWGFEFSLSKNCIVLSLLWKLSSSLLVSPALTFFCVGQNFRPRFKIDSSSLLRTFSDRLTTSLSLELESLGSTFDSMLGIVSSFT